MAVAESTTSSRAQSASTLLCMNPLHGSVKWQPSPCLSTPANYLGLSEQRLSISLNPASGIGCSNGLRLPDSFSFSLKPVCNTVRDEQQGIAFTVDVYDGNI